MLKLAVHQRSMVIKEMRALVAKYGSECCPAMEEDDVALVESYAFSAEKDDELDNLARSRGDTTLHPAFRNIVDR